MHTHTQSQIHDLLKTLSTATQPTLQIQQFIQAIMFLLQKTCSDAEHAVILFRMALNIYLDLIDCYLNSYRENKPQPSCRLPLIAVFARISSASPQTIDFKADDDATNRNWHLNHIIFFK